MRTHAAAGAAILSGSESDVLRLAERIALTHHEWWNGEGYPARLRGGQIPQCGRIVALADVFDALTHERPYKAAWPVEKAVDEVRRLRGTQFDPDVVDAFEELDAEKLAGYTAERPNIDAAA
jgi:putative two-component system response regulator